MSLTKTTDTEEVVEEVLLYSARYMNVPYRAVIGKTRNRRCVAARAMAMVYAVKEGHTLEDVADAFDMDHSTVFYHREKHEVRLRDDSIYRSRTSCFSRW